MEVCQDGTLSEMVRKQGLLQQQTIFSVFYQLMQGYQVLWQNKILHQDLKPANVLLKKGTLKITDFGFSILREKYVVSTTREGTMPYMSYEKLSDPKFVADDQQDVYSLGVIMYEVITKMHPYVNQKANTTQKDYVLALRAANLGRPKLYSTYSVQLQGLFDIVMRMCSKWKKNRILCSQIYEYMERDEIFANYRNRKAEPSVELQLQPLPIRIQQISVAYFLPFPISPENQEEYLKKIKMQRQIKLNEINRKNIQKVKTWVLSRRLVLYFFDRLGRRLIIEKIKQSMTGDIAHSYNRSILSCLAFQKRIAQDILKELKNPIFFKPQQVDSFKGCQEGQQCIKMVKKDEEYTSESINDHLKRTIQIEVKEQKELLVNAQSAQLKNFLQRAQKNLLNCADKRATNISQRNALVTLAYLLDGSKLLQTFPNVDGFELESYFYATETMKFNDLIEHVVVEMQKKGMEKPIFMLDEKEEQQRDNEEEEKLIN